MKKRLLLLAVFMMLCLQPLAVSAQDLSISVNGTVVAFPDTKPFVNEDSRTMVPVRFIAEALGAEVDWDGESRTVLINKGDTALRLPVDTYSIVVNDAEQTMDTMTAIVDGRTMVPVRFPAEYLGAEVGWDDVNKQVLITSAETVPSEPVASDKDAYTFMVFMNGTDLESDYVAELDELAGAATLDLLEMTEIGSTDRVNVVVETGGTTEWANTLIDPSQNQRWLVEADELTLLENVGKQNMCDDETLEAFLLWAIETYPAENYVLDMWNHGGGPIEGYGVDPYFEEDTLLMEELADALGAVKAQTGVTFEVIGFDACLMGNLEVAKTVQPYANYFVGSQELEPGHGWDYEAILKALTMKPAIKGDQLGKVIADGFYDQAEMAYTVDELTLSVIDLSELDAVTVALDGLFGAVSANLNEEAYVIEFFKTIGATEAFGGNTYDQGYTDLYDLGGLAMGLLDTYGEESWALLEAIDNSVVYKVAGGLHEDAAGLSVYLPFKDQERMNYNLDVAETLPMSEDHIEFLYDYVSRLEGYEMLDDVTADLVVYEPIPEDPYFALGMSEDLFERAESVLINVYEMDYEEALYRSLGYDNLILYDDYSGLFYEDFNGAWGLFDGQPVSFQYVTEDYEWVSYEIPVILNDEYVNILAVWYWDEAYEAGGYYEILGARKAIDDETDKPDKNLTILKPGDVITPVYRGLTFDTGEEVMTVGDAFEFTEDSGLSFDVLEGEEFMLRFKVVDFSGNEYYSDYFEFSFGE